MPSFMHVVHADHKPVFVSHVRVCTPHRPHGTLAGPSQTCPEQAASHWQLPPHVCMPLKPQMRVVFASHMPSWPHTPNADHCNVASSHARFCVPQLPQACEGAPSHASVPHTPHWQLPMHACVPSTPHGCSVPGAQTPGFSQVPHSDHSPFVHVRRRVPQLPHASTALPGQV
jgi:hypothetical protein